MGAFNWLNRLRRSESGNILAIGAAAMPLLVGSAAMAVDTIQLALWKRQLQRVADSSAIAGAYTLAQNGSDEDVETAVYNDFEENPHPPLETPTITPGPRAGYQKAVYVSLASERLPAFMSLFTDDPAVIEAEATAAVVQEGEYCMVSLYDGSDRTEPPEDPDDEEKPAKEDGDNKKSGIDVGGKANISLGCGMVANATGEDAVSVDGNGTVVASPIGAVGGIDSGKNGFGEGSILLPYTAPQSDPLAHVGNPDPDCDGATSRTIGNKEAAEITADTCYTSLLISPGGTLTIKNGATLYIYEGDLDIKGTITNDGQDGSAIVMTGGVNGDGSVTAGDMRINSKAIVKLRAPESGPYKDVVFYRDRRASLIDIRINGGATSYLQGAIYAPTSDITFAGGSDMDVQCLQMVGQKLKFRGNATIENTCPDGGDPNLFSKPIIRLVE